MYIFHYSADTNEYTGMGLADADPLEGGWLLPANATFVKTPDQTTGFTLVFNPQSKEWEAKLDKRGVKYWLGAEEITIKELGVDVPEEASLTEPPPTEEEPTAQDKIAELEMQVTPRNLRGAALGDEFAVSYIQSIEDQIAELRSVVDEGT